MPSNIYVDGLGDIEIPDDVPMEKTGDYVRSLAQKRGVQLMPRTMPGSDKGVIDRTIEAGIGGAKRLLSSQLTGITAPFAPSEAAEAGVRRQEAITEQPAADWGEVSRKYKEDGILSAAGEVVKQIPPAFAEWSPFLAESFAGARAGAMLPGPPQVRAAGAIAGAFFPSFIQSLGSDVERQASEQLKQGAPVDVDILKATGAAVPQGLLDVASFRLGLGKTAIAKIIGKSEKEIAEMSSKSLEKELSGLAKEGVLKTVGKGTVRGIAAEVPTEIGQQVLERWQAGLPLADEDALKEYGETAYGVALLGPFGAAGRFSEKGQARQELARRDAIQEFERANPDVAELSSATPSNLDAQRINAEVGNFLTQAERDKPFDLGQILERTGEDVSQDVDAIAVANELLRRGEIVREGGTDEAPAFRFTTEDERIVPYLDATQSYLYASPVTREGEQKTAEGYQVSNDGIQVTRKAKTPEEAENIKTQMDARIKRMTDEIDGQIKEQQQTIDAVRENLNVALASDMTDEQLSEEHDRSDKLIQESSAKIKELEDKRATIAQETQVTAIGEKPAQEQGYEVRLYRPGQTAKTVMPFASREDAEKFIVQNAPIEQQRAIYEDQAPQRESLRRVQKDLLTTQTGEQEPAEAPTEQQTAGRAPQPTPEMQQRVQAVTSRLRGVLDQMGLQSIGLNVSNKLTDMVNGKITPIDGMYLDRVIYASLSADRGVLGTFGHETVHAMRELGMFSDKEWDILSRKAKSDWIKQYATEKRYSHLNPEEQIEEAIADAFGDWMGGEYKPTGVIRGLLNRIKLFLESLGSTLRGQGFDSSEKVFQRALSGELRGTREERQAEGTKYALPMTIKVDGVERPTTNNEGRQIHPTEEGIRNFWNWFGLSKIVDKQGKPIVVYHGTKQDPEFFRAKYEDGLMFFSINPKFASKWPVGTGPKGSLRAPPEGTEEEALRIRKIEDEVSARIMRQYGEYKFPEDDAAYLEDRNKVKEEVKRLTGFTSAYDFEENAGVQVLPVYLQSSNPFDPQKDYSKIEKFLLTNPKLVEIGYPSLVNGGYHKTGNWVVYENKEVINELKKLGYDGIWLAEETDGPQETIAVFSPTQIKSAIGNVGTFSPTDKRVKYALSLEDYKNLSPEAQQVMAEDFLYSPLNRLISNAPKKLDGQSAVSWKQWLTANVNQAGGKEGEYFWTGLDEWLANQGKNKVTQGQIAEYLKGFDNPRDVVYEAAGRPPVEEEEMPEDWVAEYEEFTGSKIASAFRLFADGSEYEYVVIDSGDRPYGVGLFELLDDESLGDQIELFNSLEEAKEYVAYENTELGEGNTRYARYVLDGGDNYREIPVVLSGPSAKKIQFDFYNSHFPDANVLYHLRTNDRQDEQGNNVLFIEEVQSDWAQRGREAGFTQNEEERIERERKRQELQLQIDKLHNQLRKNPKMDSESKDNLRAEIKRIDEERNKLEPIPVGPYVQDTGKWVELAAKRIIAMAVNGGYDKVAFINPAQAHFRFPQKADGGSTQEGFEGFYGKILPNKLNSLLKKYNSKVEIVNLPVVGDWEKWQTEDEVSQQLGFVVTPELADSVRKNGFPKHALPMNVLAQGERKPTTNANGLQIHPTKDGVRNFWRWFGDGQLVDSAGRPRVFYHGSLKDIEKFKRGTADAIFFAPSARPINTFINFKLTYEQRAKGEMLGTAYPVYINAKNVFDYENPEHVDALVEEVMKGAKMFVFKGGRKVVLHPYYSVKTPLPEGGEEEEFLVAPESVIEPRKFSKEGLREKIADGNWPTFETGEVIAAIKKLGFDGFQVQENFGGQFYKNVAVFSPNQIKSAVGNNGQFAPNDARIQHALALPRAAIQQSINKASKRFNPRQDPLFATPWSSPQAGINVLNQSINNSPMLNKFKAPVRNASLNLGGKLHQFFQLSGLADLYGDDLPLRPYYNAIRNMMGARDKYIHESTEISERWQRLNARSLQDGNNTATVMNRATFYKYDPSKDKGNKNPRNPQTKEEVEIQRMFDALPAPYKQLYVDVRNFYRNRFDQFFKLLEQRVKDSIKDPKRANDVIEELKKKYNYYNQIEPYFPLTRFGEYWVRYTENGQMKFDMFENASDQDAFRTKIMSNPNITDIKFGKKIAELQGELGANDFVNKIMTSLDQAGGGYMGQAQIDELKDSVWQLYLSSLPELSMRKQFMHRSNVPGFSNDALRAFQKNSFHGAYHMARLEFGNEAAKKLDDIRRFVSNLQDTNHPDAVRLTEVFQSVAGEQRQKQIWRPDDTSAPFRIAGQIGFLYYLSTAASAVTNLTQNLTHAFPIIGAEFGYDRATKEFARAYKQFFESPSLDDFSDITKSKSSAEAVLQADKGIRSIFDITRTLEQLRNEAKTQAEKNKYSREIDAINHLYQTVISRSQAMDLAGATDRVTMSTNKFQVGMRFIAMAFHGAEILNRTTTGIVAYRLQMEKLAKERPNLSEQERHEMAVNRSSEIVDQSHYNYSEANRSPFMGSLGQLGKVIFMFKSYAIAETTFLFNAARVWSRVLRARWQGTPLEQKAIDDSKQAKRMLLGVLGMQATFAGVLGLPTPLMMIVMGLANMMGDDEDDEDKDLPSEIKFKQFLVETFGDNLAQAIAYGPVSYVTGADFNSRVGLNNLWFRDPNPAEDELDQAKNWFLQMGGPIVGLGTNFVQGYTMMEQGQVSRGLEKMVPNIVKGPLQSMRFAEEGATTAKGDTILDSLSTEEQALAFLGFTPMRLSLEYKQQSDIRGAMFRANLAKKRILLRFNMAARAGDYDSLEEITEDIESYNRRYPSYAITYDTLSRSIKASRAAQRETVRGLRIPKKQREIAEGVSWLNEDEEG